MNAVEGSFNMTRCPHRVIKWSFPDSRRRRRPSVKKCVHVFKVALKKRLCKSNQLLGTRKLDLLRPRRLFGNELNWGEITRDSKGGGRGENVCCGRRWWWWMGLLDLNESQVSFASFTCLFVRPQVERETTKTRSHQSHERDVKRKGNHFGHVPASDLFLVFRPFQLRKGGEQKKKKK